MNQILQCQAHLSARKVRWTISMRCTKTQQWVLSVQSHECVVAIPIKYIDPFSWTEFVDRFIRIEKLTNMMNIVPIRTIVGCAQLVQENAASGDIDCN